MADEYILKDKVLNLIEHNDRVYHYADERYENVVYATAQTLCMVVADISAADVQPVKHGRWENEHIEDDEAWWADCTNCKNETHSKYGRVSFYAFCPNCGARMEEEQDD